MPQGRLILALPALIPDATLLEKMRECGCMLALSELGSCAPELLQALTRKQLLVLERMTKGESNKQIAYTLEIAETTVKAHVSAILRKLNVHNRVQAILSAGDIDFGSYLRR